MCSFTTSNGMNGRKQIIRSLTICMGTAILRQSEVCFGRSMFWEVSSVESFHMEIAGFSIGVEPLFQSTKEYCRPYLTETSSDFLVHISQDDLAAEQLRLEKEAVEQGLKIRKFKEPFLERSIIQRRVADFFIGKGTLMLHGSTVALDGSAYLFTAPCGTGKSTHTRLWREYFGARAVMVNDDKPFLRITSDGVLAYGSPWCGKHGLASNICVPLKGICVLRRGKENVIRSADPDKIRDFLYNQAHSPEDADLQQKARILVDTLLQTVPLWQMDCNMNLEAAEVSYSAMGAQSNMVHI